MARRITSLFIGAAATALGGFAAQAHELTAAPLSGPPGPNAPQAHARGFAAPEAVYVPPGAGFAVVSNTNRPEKGFLSKLGLDGRIQELHWVEDEAFAGLTGMRSHEDTLWVASGTEIISVDMTAGEVTGVYACPDARFINDIATGPDGTVYGSESFAGGVYMIAPGSETCEWFLEGGDPLLQTVNGLYGAEDALMVVTIPGNVLSVDYGTKEVTQLGSGVGSLDGIEPYPDGGFLLSDTRGKLVHFHEGEVQVLNDSSSAGIGANDMAFDPETGTALIARLSFDMISLYKVSEETEE